MIIQPLLWLDKPAVGFQDSIYLAPGQLSEVWRCTYLDR